MDQESNNPHDCINKLVNKILLLCDNKPSQQLMVALVRVLYYVYKNSSNDDDIDLFAQRVKEALIVCNEKHKKFMN